MSNTNKITQLINKICHRSAKDDAEDSACQVDDANIQPTKKMKKITLLQKRLLWCITGIVLLVAGYFWGRMPAQMRVVAVIPREINDIGWYTPLGFYNLSQPTPLCEYSFLTLYGWDGKECWSKRLPGNSYNINLAFSPDGHIAAICIFKNAQITLMSLRDGHELGKLLLRKDNQFDTIDLNNITVENSGRIWLYKWRNPTCVIWAIDGTHIAAGQLAIPRMQGDRPEYLWNFSTEYNMMAVRQGRSTQRILKYLLLTVQGARIIVKQTIIHKNAIVYGYNSGLEFDKNGVLRRFSGEFVYNPGKYLDGWIVNGTNNKLLYLYQLIKELKHHLTLSCITLLYMYQQVNNGKYFQNNR